MLRAPPLAHLCAAASLLLAACGGPDTATGFSSAPPTTVPAESDATSTGTSTSSSGSSSSSSDSGGGSAGSGSSSSPAVWDMGTLPDFGGRPPGCQGKIDFLFVISSWYSMKGHQAQLQEAFPAFIDIIEKDFDEFDYQIMVVDAAGYSWLSECDSCYMCMNCNGCEAFDGPADFPCQETPTGCDKTKGAGVTMPANFGASNQRCELFGDNRYIVKGEPELLDTFTCIATLGEGPTGITAMQTVTAALQPEILGDGGCNAGFLRDDALLVLVVLQGDHDDLSPGNPKIWWEFLLDKKNGNPDAVVALIVSNDNDIYPNGWCQTGLASKNPLRTLAETVTHGRFESICAPTFVPFLEEGAELILDQCELLVPQ